MKRIKVKSNYTENFVYSSDVDRIIEVMGISGLEVSPEQARLMWENHSESMAAGWLILHHKDEDLFMELRPYFDVIE